MSFLSVLAHLARQKEGTINQDEINEITADVNDEFSDKKGELMADLEN